MVRFALSFRKYTPSNLEIDLAHEGFVCLENKGGLDGEIDLLYLEKESIEYKIITHGGKKRTFVKGKPNISQLILNLTYLGENHDEKRESLNEIYQNLQDKVGEIYALFDRGTHEAKIIIHYINQKFKDFNLSKASELLEQERKLRRPRIKLF